MKNELTKKQIAWLKDRLTQSALSGDCYTAHWLIYQAPEFAKTIALDLERLARQNRKYETERVFQAFRTYSPNAAIVKNFIQSAKHKNCGTWMNFNMSKSRTKKELIKMLSFCMLNIAQGMGLLEDRDFRDDGVIISASLPIKIYPWEHPVYAHKNPTYLGRHPDALENHYCIFGPLGTPNYEEVLARDLNKLSQDKLWWIATNMARFLDEDRAVLRALAVIDYDTPRIDDADLNYFFGDNGPLELEDVRHIDAVRRFLDYKPELGRFLGPKLTAALL